MIHVIVSRQIKLITENSQRELIVNIIIKKKKKSLKNSMKIPMKHQLKQLNATENGYNHIIPPHFKIHSYTSIFVFIFVLCVKNTYLLA